MTLRHSPLVRDSESGLLSCYNCICRTMEWRRWRSLQLLWTGRRKPQTCLATAAAMRRVIARDPVSQARFFALMMDIFFEEVLGVLPPLWRESYRVGYAREFEDGMATSLSGGVFGDVAAFCGPLETQGSQKVAAERYATSAEVIWLVVNTSWSGPVR